MEDPGFSLDASTPHGAGGVVHVRGRLAFVEAASLWDAATKLITLQAPAPSSRLDFDLSPGAGRSSISYEGDVHLPPRRRRTIIHRDSPHEIGYYDDRVWTEKPTAYVRRALVRALYDDRGLKQVLSGASLTLDVDVVAFEEVREPAHVGRISLDHTLSDDRVVRRSRSLVVERPISAAQGGDAASEVVQALSDALGAAAESIAEAAATELQAEEAPEGKPRE